MGMDSASLVLYAVLLAITACFLHLKSSNRKRLGLPPGPHAWPVLGSLPSLRPPLHRHFYNLSKKYGPVVYIKVGAMQMVSLNDAESCNELLNDRDLEFANRPSSSAFEKFSFGYKAVFCSNYGKSVSTLRKVSNLHLFSARNMNASEPLRVNEIYRQVKEIYDGCQGGAVNLVNMRKLSSNYVQNVMSLSLFGEVDHEVYALVEQALQCMRNWLLLEELFPLFSILSCHLTKTGSLDDLMPKLKIALTKQLDKHRARKDAAGDSFKPVDFVDALISLPGEYDVAPISMLALLVDLFAAGIETTRALIEFTMGKVVNYPEVMQKAQDEIDRVVGRSQWVGETSELPYVQAIVKEVLRLHPPGPIGGPHCSLKETTIGGYRIPAGCKIFANIWALGNDPKYWEDADKFLPERFLGKDIGITGHYPGYMPFSRGRRGCVGSGLAMRSASLAVATLIQAFDWKVPPGRVNINLKEKSGTTLLPADEVVAVATPRLPENMYN